MRSAPLFALLVACTTTRTVPRSELAALVKPRGDGVVLKTTSEWKTRLDPASHIRFRNRAGTWSDWLRGDELYIAPDGLYRNAKLDLVTAAARIEIRGLDERGREILARARPAADADLAFTDDGTAVLVATPAAFDVWVTQFFHRLPPAYQPNAPTCGSWSFYFAGREPIVFAGESLYQVIDDGLASRYGYRWQDIDSAEVKSLSGSLTLGAVIGVSALAIALAPVALVARGLPIPGDGPHGGGSSGSSGGLRAAGNLTLGGGGGEKLARGTWAPTPADHAALSAPSLFDGNARRKTTIQLVASAEASIGSLGAHPFVEGGAAAVRLGQVFEVGAGGLHLVTRESERFEHAGLAFFRIGLHLPFDAAHRIAVPLSVDVGGGGGEALGVFTRLNWGLRIGVGNQAFVGITPLSPMFLNWKHDPSRRRGSVMSGLEAGVSW